MKIKLLPNSQAVPLAILSMTGLDNRELNPAIEKQLNERQLTAPKPQSALGDLMAVVGDRHPASLHAWDAALIGSQPVNLQVTDQQVSLHNATGVYPPDLDSKSSQVLVVIAAKAGDDDVVHATGQDLQRKLKAFFGIQARLQFRTFTSTIQVINTTKSVS